MSAIVSRISVFGAVLKSKKRCDAEIASSLTEFGDCLYE